MICTLYVYLTGGGKMHSGSKKHEARCRKPKKVATATSNWLKHYEINFLLFQHS